MTAPDGLAYSAAVVLAAVFATAAVAKWRDPAGTARGFRALGVPRPWPSARAVPVAESAVAVALAVTPAAGAAAAAALLAAFSVFLVARIRAGVTAPCRCFGGGAGHDLSWADLVRNAWLLAAAGVAVTADRPELPSTAAAASTAVAAAVAALTVRLARDTARRRARRS